MNDYLTENWPLAETSTVFMSGKSVFQIRRYDKPGIITTVEMFAADAQAVRDAVSERVKDAQHEALREAASIWRKFIAAEKCPTCEMASRETVGMVCQTCGTDYGASA